MKSPLPTNIKKKEPMFQFSEVVVIEENLVGCIVKTWESMRGGENKGYNYDVYVRSFNAVVNYEESKIMQFIYDKELTEEALIYYEKP